MKKVLSIVLIIAMMLTMASMLASCGESTDSKDSAKDKDTVTLKVLTNRTDRVADGGDGTLEKRTEAFEKANNCKVEYTAFTDYEGDISTKLNSDEYGDVLLIPDTVELKDLGNFFEPLGTYDELKDTYRWTDKKMYDWTVYGIAVGGAAKGVLYNTKVWADAGITELPKTPEAFIECLQMIKDNTEAIPFYTQFKDSSWTLNQWSDLVLSAAGSADYKVTNLLQNKEELFAEDGGYYKVFKLMYDVFSNSDLIEEDPTTTEWESSKQWMADGKIGTMVMGSWAVSQFQSFAEGHEDDIGYMPAPFTAEDGNQYAQTSGDYCMAVSKHSENKELAKKYVEWFALESGFAQDEGMISTNPNDELPDNLSAFADCVLIEETVAPDELQGKFDEIDKGDAANVKIKLAAAAFAGKGEDGFKAILDDCNSKWATSRDSILG